MIIKYPVNITVFTCLLASNPAYITMKNRPKIGMTGHSK